MKSPFFNRLLSCFALIAIFLSIGASPIHAESTSEILADYADNVADEKGINIDQIFDRHFTDVFKGILAAIYGMIKSDGEAVRPGMIHDVSRVTAYLLTQPPAQPSHYIADVLDNSGLVEPAYAQGIGFSSLSPVLQLWKAFRNMAYFFFILIFIIIGFMIMFRKQIDHQAVVTMQMALPKIIFTLILITLSYAIAGFVVDMIYMTIFIVTGLFQSFGIIQSAASAQGALFNESAWRIGWHYFVLPLSNVGEAASSSISKLVTASFGMPGLWWLTGLVTSSIMAIAIIIQLFRTMLALISAYIGLILSVIFAPIQLLFNAIPGSNTFNSWLRGLIANAAVFPAVGIMILIGAALATSTGSGNDDLGISGLAGDTAEGFVPPLLISQANVDAAGINFIGPIIGIGILMLLPEIAKMVKEALEVKGEFGETALANFSSGTNPIKSIFSPVGSILNAAGGYVVSYAALKGLGGAVNRISNTRRGSRNKFSGFNSFLRGHQMGGHGEVPGTGRDRARDTSAGDSGSPLDD